MKISIYSRATHKSSKETIVFEQYLENIKNGTWQDHVIPIRRMRQKYVAGEVTKKEYQEAKTHCPAVAASGVFNYLNAQGLEQHSGILAIDFDAEIGETIDRYVLEGDPYSYAVHQSIGGDGLVVYVKIEPDKHLEAFLALEQYYANTYKLTVDKACKDVCRMRYVSWDIDLFLNDKSKVFKSYLPKTKQQPQNKIYTQTNNDIEHIIKQLQTKGIDITVDYYNWIEIGFGFAREYGEIGRQYFHDVSSINAGYSYQDCDKKYTNLMRRATSASSTGKRSSLGTFVWLAAQNGCEIKTARTQAIEGIGKIRANSVGKSGGLKDKDTALQSAIKTLEMGGISGDDVPEILDKVFQMSPEQIKGNLTGDVIEDAKGYIKMLPLRFNEITRAVEYNGKPIDDHVTNGLYLDTLAVLKDTQKGKQLSKAMFEIILDSKEIESYHPFMEFFQKNAYMKPKGLIDDFLDCIIFEDTVGQKEREDLRFLTGKWLCSIIASMHGTYSILCLVLCGKMGKGKTNFFRRLLPKELLDYYGESKLDREKDDEILMTQKLILCDDEFGGKSKQDAKKLRDLLAKQRFTVRAPYARRPADLLRIAVLCGTSNEKDVLSDLEGNRRILPLNIKSIDFEKYNAIDKTMLFMELYHTYIEYQDTSFMLDDEDIKRLNELTFENEENCQELEAFFMFFSHPNDGGVIEWMTPTEIRNHIEINTRLKINPKRLGAALRKVGIEPKNKKVGGFPALRYAVCKKSLLPTSNF